MSYIVSLSVDNDVLEALQDVVKSSRRELSRELKKAQKQMTATLLEMTSRRKTPPVKYPIEWQSDKQRKAFFARKGFERGIPTKRTGAIEKGWGVFVRDDAGFVSVENNVPYAEYVVGKRQQKFHRNTGWVKIDDLVVDTLSDANNTLIEIWGRVSRLE